MRWRSRLFKKAGGNRAALARTCSTYLALHYARGKDWARAVPLLEQVVAESPERLPALEALAVVRERQGRVADAVGLRQRIYRLRTPTTGELVQLGQLAMSARADAAGHRGVRGGPRASPRRHSRTISSSACLYLAARRLPDAAAALDRVPASSPEYPMALFKRAQASVLLGEPDQKARIDAARRHADATTRPLIEREQSVRGEVSASCQRAANSLRTGKREAESPATRRDGASRLELEAQRQLEAPRIVVVPRRVERGVVDRRLEVVAGLAVRDVEQVADDLDVVAAARACTFWV